MCILIVCRCLSLSLCVFVYLKCSRCSCTNYVGNDDRETEQLKGHSEEEQKKLSELYIENEMKMISKEE